MSALELAYRIENESEEVLKVVEAQGTQFKFDSFGLKKVSAEYPIGELAECLYIQKE